MLIVVHSAVTTEAEGLAPWGGLYMAHVVCQMETLGHF